MPRGLALLQQTAHTLRRWIFLVGNFRRPLGIKAGGSPLPGASGRQALFCFLAPESPWGFLAWLRVCRGERPVWRREQGSKGRMQEWGQEFPELHWKQMPHRGSGLGSASGPCAWRLLLSPSLNLPSLLPARASTTRLLFKTRALV